MEGGAGWNMRRIDLWSERHTLIIRYDAESNPWYDTVPRASFPLQDLDGREAVTPPVRRACNPSPLRSVAEPPNDITPRLHLSSKEIHLGPVELSFFHPFENIGDQSESTARPWMGDTGQSGRSKMRALARSEKEMSVSRCR
jgi:hypothetical protein